MEVLAEKQHEENGAKLIVNGNKTVNVGEEGKHSSSGKNGVKKVRRKKRADSVKEKQNNGTNGQISSDHSRIHVRSYDSSKAIKKFNMSGEEQVGTCRVCSRQVFQMERVKAEGACWHRNCFRCVECNRQLSVDTYASHGGQLYCQPHHKQLFLPKAVEADQQEQAPRRRKHEMIIRESEPVPLPDGIIRASSKSDYGLEDLQHLNVRDRFAMFENGTPTTPSGGDHQNQYQAELTASGSIANKMKKFQRRCHGDGEMNGDDCRLSDGDSSVCSESASEQEEDGEVREEKVVRSNRKHYREQAGSFSGMSDAKSRFEGGMTRREMLREERKGELTRLRDMICGAREHRAAYEEALKEQNKEKEKKCLDDFPQISQESLKASYQRALQEGSLSSAVGEDSTVPVSRQLASSLAHKFESGQLDHSDGQADETRRWREEEAELFQEANTARDARSMFLQMDTQGSVQQPLSRSPSSVSTRPASLRQSCHDTSANGSEVVKCSTGPRHDDVRVETSAISSRFRFFETYREQERRPPRRFRFTPPPEGSVDQSHAQVDAELDSIDGQNDDEEREVLLKSHTARLMLDKFKQLETDGRQGSDVSGVNREVASGNARQVLSLFKQMEENAMREDLSDGPRPLKCMTPPADYTGDTGSEEEYTYTDEDGDPDDSEFQEEDDQFNMSHDRARSLRARFEQWEKMGEHESSFNVEDECRPSLDTAKNLRAMFEALKDQPQAVQKSQPKVSRFVGLTPRILGNFGAVEADSTTAPPPFTDSSSPDRSPEESDECLSDCPPEGDVVEGRIQSTSADNLLIEEERGKRRVRFWDELEHDCSDSSSDVEDECSLQKRRSSDFEDESDSGSEQTSDDESQAEDAGREAASITDSSNKSSECSEYIESNPEDSIRKETRSSIVSEESDKIVDTELKRDLRTDSESSSSESSDCEQGTSVGSVNREASVSNHTGCLSNGSASASSDESSASDEESLASDAETAGSDGESSSSENESSGSDDEESGSDTDTPVRTPAVSSNGISSSSSDSEDESSQEDDDVGPCEEDAIRGNKLTGYVPYHLTAGRS